MSEPRKMHAVGRHTPLVERVLRHVGFDVHKEHESVVIFGLDEHRHLARAFVLETEAALIRHNHVERYGGVLVDHPGIEDATFARSRMPSSDEPTTPTRKKEKTVKIPTTYEEAQALVAKRGRQLDFAKGVASELRHVSPPGTNIAAVAFWIRFEEDGDAYDFLAQRVTTRSGELRWFTTGSTCPRHGFTWPNLVAFVRSGVEHGPINPAFPGIAVIMEGGSK